MTAVITSSVAVANSRNRIGAESWEGFFEKNRTSFDKVRMCIARSRTRSDCDYLLQESARSDLLTAVLQRVGSGSDFDVSVGVSTMFVVDLPNELREISSGEVVGPVRSNDGFVLGEGYWRRPAEIDTDTVQAVKTAAYRDHLRRRRQQTEVKWHWR
jgi:hypothetical protein